MRKLRTGYSPSPEEWDKEDLMTYLDCDMSKAKQIMEECRRKYKINGYGPIEKHLILDFINEKQRAEKEREARYKSDLSNIENISVLKEQVKTLQEISKTSTEDARKARIQALIANFIAGISLVISILALVLN